ncbi:MAG: hypothetical protein HAW60_05915, partial [Bdellovibrionales bacterium]|nr:hypothetical protein [Bdellovibrionales bacterium]
MKEVKKNKTSIGSVLSSLVLLFFFIGLVLIAFVKKDNIYYFTKSLFVNNVFFAKVTNFKGNILINDKLVNSLKNTFYKNVLVQTG